MGRYNLRYEKDVLLPKNIYYQGYFYMKKIHDGATSIPVAEAELIGIGLLELLKKGCAINMDSNSYVIFDKDDFEIAYHPELIYAVEIAIQKLWEE